MGIESTRGDQWARTIAKGMYKVGMAIEFLPWHRMPSSYFTRMDEQTCYGKRTFRPDEQSKPSVSPIHSQNVSQDFIGQVHPEPPGGPRARLPGKKISMHTI